MTDRLLDALLTELANDADALDRLRQLVDHHDGAAEAWIDANAAAEHLACRRRRIYDLVEQGRIPHHRDGSRVLFRRSELDAWLHETR